MRSQLAHRLRSSSTPLTTVPPPSTSAEYSTSLASLAAHILYPSPFPSPNDLPVYILNTAALPDAKTTDYDALLPYVLARLPDEERLIEGQGYELVFFAGGSPDGSSNTKKGRPGWSWFFQAYHVLSRATRKKLQKLYIVHEKNWIRILIEMFSTVVSPKFRKKVVHASTLSGLALHIPIEDLLIPPSAYFTDRRRTKTIDVPYATGKRAFGVKDPLPRSSSGLLRLPRVLREATSFVIMDALIKKEGLFRISPRATTVDILAEAYERAQKFIVWREGEIFLTHGHMKEGTGTVYVHELDETEGYELHAATALIKQWYRDLRDPIFPPSCYAPLEKFYGTAGDGTEITLPVPQLLQLLSVDAEWSPISEMSRIILTMHLLPLLARVTDFQEWNQMSAYNLAVCFAPCLIRGPDPIEDMKITSVILRILATLIMHWNADLAPRFDEMNGLKFEDSLRMPEAVEDREDPVQERQGPRTSLEAQVSGITLVDNDDSEDDDEEVVDERPPPPLPPRPLATSMTSSPINSPTATATPTTTPWSPVRRKPAPLVQNLPRYSMVIHEMPATLEHLDSYNSVPLGDFEPVEVEGGFHSVPEVADLPSYEPSAAASGIMPAPNAASLSLKPKLEHQE